MAVKIRLTRIGSKKRPSYRIVVADSRSPRDGKIIEQIGRYVPTGDPKFVEFDRDLAIKWISKGAQPTDTVARLFRDYGLDKESPVEEAETPAEEAQVSSQETEDSAQDQDAEKDADQEA